MKIVKKRAIDDIKKGIKKMQRVKKGHKNKKSLNEFALKDGIE